MAQPQVPHVASPPFPSSENSDSIFLRNLPGGGVTALGARQTQLLESFPWLVLTMRGNAHNLR